VPKQHKKPRKSHNWALKNKKWHPCCKHGFNTLRQRWLAGYSRSFVVSGTATQAAIQ
jgi:hypothetical protein